MEGQYPDWWCKKGSPTPMTTTTTPTPKPTANIAVVQHSTTSGHGEYYAFMMNTQGHHKGLITYADSAASDHCFVDIKDFVTYQPSTGKDGDTAAKGGKFTIAGMGRVDKRAVFNGRIITLSFKDVMHTPDLSHNLISIGKLETKGGCYSIFGSGGVTFIDRDQRPFLQGQRMGTMYEVDVHSPTGPIPSKPNVPYNLVLAAQAAYSTIKAFATCSHNHPTNIDTWHRRLGHAGYAIVKCMSKKDLVDGMSVMMYERGPGRCEDCIMGKQTRRPFDDNEHPEENVLDRVHIDLWGPSRVQSNGGKSYMMQMVDSTSAHTDVYFLADKRGETTHAAFQEYHVMAE